MFEAKLSEGYVFKKIVEAIKDIVVDVNLDVGPTGKFSHWNPIFSFLFGITRYLSSSHGHFPCRTRIPALELRGLRSLQMWCSCRSWHQYSKLVQSLEAGWPSGLHHAISECRTEHFEHQAGESKDRQGHRVLAQLDLAGRRASHNSRDCSHLHDHDQLWGVLSHLQRALFTLRLSWNHHGDWSGQAGHRRSRRSWLHQAHRQRWLREEGRRHEYCMQHASC